MIFALGTAIGMLSPQASRAVDQDKDVHENIAIPSTVDGIIKEIERQDKALADTVQAKKLSEVHEHAFAIRDLAKALPAKLDSDHKKMVSSVIRRVAQTAEELDASGDAGDQNATEANLKKMDAALDTLKEHATM
jgi:hypothetical protein